MCAAPNLNLINDLKAQITCSISLDEMRDPVRISCPEEHSFDRVWIENALKNSDKCPLCRGLLKNKTLRINRELKSIVDIIKLHESSTPSNAMLPEKVQPLQSESHREAKIALVTSSTLPPLPSAPPLSLSEAQQMGIDMTTGLPLPYASSKKRDTLPSNAKLPERVQPLQSENHREAKIALVTSSTLLPLPSAPPLSLSEAQQMGVGMTTGLPLPYASPKKRDIFFDTAPKIFTPEEYMEIDHPLQVVNDRREIKSDLFLKPLQPDTDLEKEKKGAEKTPSKSRPELKAAFPKEFDPLKLIDAFKPENPEFDNGFFDNKGALSFLRSQFVEKKWDKTQFAVVFKRLDVLEQLYKQDSSITKTKDNEGRTLLMIAAGWEGGAIAEWLIEKDPALLDQFIEKKFFRFLLSVISRNSDQEPKELQPGASPLHFAARSGNLVLGKLFVKLRPSLLEQFTVGGFTPLHFAAEHGHKEFFQWLIQIKPSLLHQTNKDGLTPFHRAHPHISSGFFTQDPLMKGHMDFFREWDFPNWWSWITQSLSKNPSSTHFEIFRVWLNGQNTLKALGQDNHAPEERQAAAEGMASKLAGLFYKEDPCLKQMADTKGEKLEDKFCFGSISNYYLKYGWGILEISLILGRLDIVQDYFKHYHYKNPFQERDGSGFEAGFTDLEKQTDSRMWLHMGTTSRNWLHIAAGWGGHLKIVKWLVAQDRSLLRQIHHIGSYGGHQVVNALHYAAYFGRLEVVKWLVEEDSSLLCETGEVKNHPVDLAAHNGHLSTTQFLIQRDPSLMKRYLPLESIKGKITEPVYHWLLDFDRKRK